MKLFFIPIVFLFVTSSSKKLNPKKVQYANDCGAPSSHKSQADITYERDIQSDPDTVVADYTSNSEYNQHTIKYTKEPEIYMTERHSYKSFQYKVPLQKEGTYVLILKFAELFFKEKNQRVFHIKFGNKRVVESLDIFEKVGRFAAYDEYIEFEYTLGQIFFKGAPCMEAIQGGQLLVTFEKTKKDNPFVHGIVLYAGNLNGKYFEFSIISSDTDYYQLDDYRKNWEINQKLEQKKKEEEKLKKQEAKTKKREKVKIRNDHLNELEIEFEQIDFVPEKSNESRLSLKQLILSPIGVLTLWTGFGGAVFLLMKFFQQIDSFDISEFEKKKKESPEKEQTKSPVEEKKKEPKKEEIKKQQKKKQ